MGVQTPSWRNRKVDGLTSQTVLRKLKIQKHKPMHSRAVMYSIQIYVIQFVNLVVCLRLINKNNNHDLIDISVET